MSKHHLSEAPFRRSGARYRAEIIEHRPRHPDGSVTDNKLLAIIDLHEPGSRSVTNAIEDVLHELRLRFGLDLPPIIIYRDTEGVWDGVAHIEGTFRAFYPIRETDRARAIDKALGRRQRAASADTDRLEPQ
jgi:hypothetical protein